MSAERVKPQDQKPLDALSTSELVNRLHSLNYQLGFFGVTVSVSTMIEPSVYTDLFPNHPYRDQLIPYTKKPRLSLECYQAGLLEDLREDVRKEVEQILGLVAEVGIILKRKLKGDVKWDESLTDSPRKHFGECLREAAFID